MSHKYVPVEPGVKEIMVKRKLQQAKLESLCSEVTGHVCASPRLNLTAAAVGTVIAQVLGINHTDGAGGWTEAEKVEGGGGSASLRTNGHSLHAETNCSPPKHSPQFFIFYFFVPKFYRFFQCTSIYYRWVKP